MPSYVAALRPASESPFIAHNLGHSIILLLPNLAKHPIQTKALR